MFIANGTNNSRNKFTDDGTRDRKIEMEQGIEI